MARKKTIDELRIEREKGYRQYSFANSVLSICCRVSPYTLGMPVLAE